MNEPENDKYVPYANHYNYLLIQGLNFTWYVGSTRLQLTLASLGNLNNDLAPSVSASERHQGVGDGF